MMVGFFKFYFSKQQHVFKKKSSPSIKKRANVIKVAFEISAGDKSVYNDLQNAIWKTEMGIVAVALGVPSFFDFFVKEKAIRAFSELRMMAITFDYFLLRAVGARCESKAPSA